MLKDIKVLEFEGLVPSIFCGMILADQGADVIVAARKKPAVFSVPIENNVMNRSKKSIIVDLKDNNDRNFLESIIKDTHIIIDPYRPGVLEKQGFGPEYIFKLNPKVLILRVSGYGQKGQMALRPGHDLNYLSVSGILPLINQQKQGYEKIQFPANYLADFVSTSLAITGTLAALQQIKATGIGKIIDFSLAQGCRYYTNIITSHKQKVNCSEHKKYENNKSIQYIKVFQKQWCISKPKEINISRQQILQIIKKMIRSKKQYYRGQNNIQISEMAQLTDYQNQISTLTNIFDNSSQGSKISAQRGRQDKEFRQKYLRKFIAPKL